jgi:hypothetical protein
MAMLAPLGLRLVLTWNSVVYLASANGRGIHPGCGGTVSTGHVGPATTRPAIPECGAAALAAPDVPNPTAKATSAHATRSVLMLTSPWRDAEAPYLGSPGRRHQREARGWYADEALARVGRPDRQDLGAVRPLQFRRARDWLHAY